MRFLAVIPARLGSTRLPGKPLIDLGTKTLIQQVYEPIVASKLFERVIVATDGDAVFQQVRSFGGEVEMTKSTHETGTDRVAEVAERHLWADVVANIQGDQPFLPTATLSALLAPFSKTDNQEDFPPMTTVACPLEPSDDVTEPNVVKVVCDTHGRALYFSRSPLPFQRTGKHQTLRHLGLYAFSRDFLLQFTRMPRTPLEKCEDLEQLRALENGFAIHVERVEQQALEINTPQDHERAAAALKG